MKIVVAGALPQELKPLLNHIKQQGRFQTRTLPVIRATHLNHELAVVVTGVGIRNAEEAVESALDAFHPGLILSIGFAGALYEGAAIGDVVVAASVSLVSQNPLKVTASLPVDVKLLEGRLDTMNAHLGTFFTLGAPTEKNAARALVPAGAPNPVCEMETFPLAELAQKKGIEFLAARSITDLWDEEIPSDFFAIAESSGARQRIKAASLFLRKPNLIPMATKLTTRSRKASENLWLFFDALARVF